MNDFRGAAGGGGGFRGGRGGGGFRGGRGGGWNNRRPWRWMNKNRGRGGASRGARNPAEGENSAPTTPPNNEGAGLDCNDKVAINREISWKRDGGCNDTERQSPPRPPKRRKSTKNGIILSWKKKLPGYRLYYPDIAPQLSDIDKKIVSISDYLLRRGYLQEERLLEIEDKEYFEVICEHVLKDKSFMEKWPDFLQELIDKPTEVVNLWGAVMHKLVSEYLNSETNEKDCRKTVRKIHRIHAGLLKVDPVVPLASINSSHVGKFIAIRGQIVGTGPNRAVCLQMPFFCKICEEEFLVDQPYGIFTLPTLCGVSEECHNRHHFVVSETSDKILMMDSRKIKLQDVLKHEIEKGAVPITIECELTNDLVNQCNTGDTVTITGVVKMKKEFNFNGEQSLHNLYIEVIAMRNHREAERTMGGHWFSFSDKDYCAVREIYDTPNLLKLLVASLCPSIYGHELVKAALILSLFGGTSHADDFLSRRSDINILMIGDPGIGKSQMLQVITQVAPRGVYVCGTGTTIAGLTVTMVRDKDEYALEAGALIMGDRGVCCIDEFDKMKTQHPALLETMEQQSVTIAKAGVYRTLPARTTVIAAANPVGGHYDKRKSLSENVKIGTPLLSRFDITFILLDKPNKDFDDRIVDHIMGMDVKRPLSVPSTSQQDHSFVPLMARLRLEQDEVLDLIPHSIIRKYIAYARQYVKPKISPEGSAILKEYYLRLRVKHRSRDSTPITTRQLESLLRLTEARAKVELRETATAQDAKDVLEIFESSLSSAFDDEVIAVSAMSQSIIIGTPLPAGKSHSKSQANRLAGALQRTAEMQCKNIFTVDEIKHSISVLGLRSSADQLISILNNEGYLLKKGPRLFQLQSADY